MLPSRSNEQLRLKNKIVLKHCQVKCENIYLMGWLSNPLCYASISLPIWATNKLDESAKK